ncbi:serine hydrolase domain-containing protein [Sorangium sp. So ce590]|uniref:serine hydrolase n=1 Tax=Sorangium sp. So ce590 TaxID=3133317 RepID=UPI003F5D6C12
MPSQRTLLPRSAPAASGMSSRSIAALLDRLEAQSIECHSLMVVRHGHVVAEGWWAPYSAERPHLLYSLTKSFTSVAVGLAIADGLLSLDDRGVDVLPDHVPAGISEQGRRLTVHHLPLPPARARLLGRHEEVDRDLVADREPHELLRGQAAPHRGELRLDAVPEGRRRGGELVQVVVVERDHQALARLVLAGHGRPVGEAVDVVRGREPLHHAREERALEAGDARIARRAREQLPGPVVRHERRHDEQPAAGRTGVRGLELPERPGAQREATRPHELVGAYLAPLGAVVIDVNDGLEPAQAIEVEVAQLRRPRRRALRGVGLVEPELDDREAPEPPLARGRVGELGLEDDEVAVQAVGDARPLREDDAVLAAMGAVRRREVEAVRQGRGHVRAVAARVGERIAVDVVRGSGGGPEPWGSPFVRLRVAVKTSGTRGGCAGCLPKRARRRDRRPARAGSAVTWVEWTKEC